MKGGVQEMKKTLMIASGAAVGYVFGARAGRERFDAISSGSATLRDKSSSALSTVTSVVENRWPQALAPIRGVQEKAERLTSGQPDHVLEVPHQSAASQSNASQSSAGQSAADKGASKRAS